MVPLERIVINQVTVRFFVLAGERLGFLCGLSNAQS